MTLATSDEFITLLTTASGADVGKVFKGSSSRREPFAIGKEFYCAKEPVYDLQSLSKLLQNLENDPTKMVIRWSLIEAQRGPIPRNRKPSLLRLANGV